MNINVDVLGKLMPNILTILAQLGATLVLFLLMKKLAWGPAKKIMAERAAYEQNLLRQAEALKKENEELKSLMEEKLSQAEEEATETVANAQREAQRLKDNMVDEGKELSRQLVEEARHSIELQKSKMLDDMHDEIVSVALSATERMLSEKLDVESDRQVIDSFIKEVSGK
ncbi:MAG: F0F1 ATP synthase subunit B [Erysipelotrichaceae bacterium]|nr:F0F1 ATP synthase subunit B [Erysipelotrichaceae bacterium]MBQ4252852.1 F0F1 ATP synthase subunit B [Erysipelotrichaceae bacterium]MBQ7223405.1 F0F1 ATP synthase subunit B [Erysipelotrichaceae bacterium]